MEEVTCPRCHEVFVPGPVRVTESTAVVERFDPGQPRDGDGKWTDGAGPGAAAAAVTNATAGGTPETPPAGDKLGLHGRIQLGPGERLVSSGKLRSENSDTDLQFATTNGPAGAEARLATVGMGDEPDDGQWDGAGGETARLNRRQLRRLRNDLDEAGNEARTVAKAANRKEAAGEELTPAEAGDAPVASGEVRGAAGVVRWNVWLADEGDYTTTVHTSEEAGDGGDGAEFFGRGSRRLVRQLEAMDAEMGAAEAADGERAVGDRTAEADAAGEAVRDPLAGRVTAETWDPAEHPRAADGEFSKADGSGKSAADGTIGFDGRGGTGYGKKGGDPRVRELQEALNRLGVTDANGKPLAVDGQLGPKTTAAVKALQKKLGVEQDGKVTPALLAKIKAEAAKKPKPAAKKAQAKPASGGRTTMKTQTTSSAAFMPNSAKTRMTGTDDGVLEDRVVESDGRVLESLAPDEAGGRRYRVQIIAAGDSKNGRRYPPTVLQEAVRLYEGAKAFDRHRSDEELRSGTITGLVGHYSEVAGTPTGIEATLTLLPSAVHAAEVLDAALGQPNNPHVAGISHDVRAHFKPITVGGRRLAEATQIVDVMSADIVSHPAAGGLALRAVAGGIDPEDLPGTTPGSETEESDVTVTTEGVLAALQTATPEQLSAVGLARATTETTTEPDAPDRANEGQAWLKGSALGTMAVKALADAAELEPRAVEALLGDSFTESDITRAIGTAKTLLAAVERQGLTPSGTGSAQVTRESHDKKVAALDAMFAGDYSKGYRSFREAFSDITGKRPRNWDEDFNRTILRESIGGFYDSQVSRSSESVASTTWDQILGDSITRRMVAEYSRPNLSTWRRIVSSVVPLNDFRTQRIDRVGGYGTLPTVAEGAPYQPLTTPSDEEATYALSKRGGTEDLTLEAIANDDLRTISKIPQKLGLAAAWTLYRFVFDVLTANAATSYDSVALFHASHGNTTAAALTQANLSTLRRKMRQQASFGDSTDVLSILPKFLIVPSSLEEIAWQLATSAVAIPASGSSSDLPNIHQSIEPIVVDYYSDQDDWFVICDPQMCPTIEVGFYQGRETPELFTQADPTQGAMFNADKLVMKIRHIYGEVVLEHRGMQRGTQ